MAHADFGLLSPTAFLSHCTDLTDADIEALAATGAHVVHNPTAIAAVRGFCPVVRLLEVGGLVGVKMIKFDAKPCFVRNGVGMRELQLEAWKAADGEADIVEVMYKGPYRSVTDDCGNIFRRGERHLLSVGSTSQLRKGMLADSFVIFESRTSRVDVSCG